MRSAHPTCRTSTRCGSTSWISTLGAVYGPEWGYLAQETPYSTVLAAGSDIAVYPKGQLVR